MVSLKIICSDPCNFGSPIIQIKVLEYFASPPAEKNTLQFISFVVKQVYEGVADKQQ